MLAEQIPLLIKKERREDDVIKDVAVMRERLQSAQKGTAFLNIRSSDGGIMDLDFLTQMIQLLPMSDDLPLIRRSRDAGKAFEQAGLISEAEIKCDYHCRQSLHGCYSIHATSGYGYQ